MAEHDSKLEQAIQRNRSRNQTVGYFGSVLFFPVLFALKNNDSEKNLLDESQKRRDQFIIAYRYKKCAGKKLNYSPK